MIAELRQQQITVLRRQKPPSAPVQQIEPSVPNNAQLADSAKDIARRFRSLQDELNWHGKNEREAHANGVNGPIPRGFTPRRYSEFSRSGPKRQRYSDKF